MELVKVKFKGGWALAEPADVGSGKYELYVETVEAEPIKEAQYDQEVKEVPPVEVKKNVSGNGGRNRKK